MDVLMDLWCEWPAVRLKEVAAEDEEGIAEEDERRTEGQNAWVSATLWVPLLPSCTVSGSGPNWPRPATTAS